MTNIYNLCKRQIANDKKKGTHKVTIEKLDLLLINDQLTQEEYEDLVALLNADTE